MKEKELLRSYMFRKYLEKLGLNRRDFKILPNGSKVDVLKGYGEYIKNSVTLLPTKTNV